LARISPPAGDPIDIIDGKVTIPAMYDYMSKLQAERNSRGAPVYMISSDVTEQLPLGPEAKDFTTRGLSLYGGRERTLKDITRTSGTKVVKGALLNWMGGCVPDWFPHAIDPLVFNSGWCGRVFCIIGKMRKEYFNRKAPLYPHDAMLVREHLRMRLEKILRLEGLVTFSPAAEREEQAWLDRMQEALIKGELGDTDEQVINRQKAGLLKLSMIFAVAQWKEGELIRVTRSNVARAAMCLAQSLAYTKQVQDFAYTTEDTKVYTRVMDLVRASNNHEIQLSKLTAKMYQRGIKDKKHMKAVLDTLEQAGHVKVEKRLAKKTGGPRPTFICWTPKMIPLGKMFEGGKTKEETDGKEGDKGSITS
jgi:hypothetical protein